MYEDLIKVVDIEVAKDAAAFDIEFGLLCDNDVRLLNLMGLAGCNVVFIISIRVLEFFDRDAGIEVAPENICR